MTDPTLRQLADRAQIQDCLSRYARGVDRGDWALVRSTYHPDAQDQHGEYRGDIDGLITWLAERFAGVDNSMHFLGNCLIEFVASDFAFVETYFASRRLRPPGEGEGDGLHRHDAVCRETWGRYLDHFERRGGQWRVARRIVVIEAGYTTRAFGGVRTPGAAITWGTRDDSDLSYSSRAELLERAAGPSH